jgi:hypothetical protein
MTSSRWREDARSFDASGHPWVTGVRPGLPQGASGYFRQERSNVAARPPFPKCDRTTTNRRGGGEEAADLMAGGRVRDELLRDLHDGEPVNEGCELVSCSPVLACAETPAAPSCC